MPIRPGLAWGSNSTSRSRSLSGRAVPLSVEPNTDKSRIRRPIQWVGLAFAFLGVACGFLGRTKGGSLTGDALALLAAVLWAATTIVIKATRLRRIDPIKVLLYQIGFAALIAPLAEYAFGEVWPTDLTTTSVAALLWQGVVVAGVSYALWFWALTRYAVAELSPFTFITPLVGVLAGWLAFGET
jgi:drug/metabolite transporter (DMT)-like permease